MPHRNRARGGRRRRPGRCRWRAMRPASRTRRAVASAPAARSSGDPDADQRRHEHGAKPMPNSATWDQSLVVSTSRRPSASYHMTSVIRFTTPPSSPSTISRPRIPPPISSHRRHGTSPTGHRREGWPAPAPVGPTGAFPCPRRWASRSVRCARNAPDARRAALALRVGLGLAALKLFEELVEPA